MKHARQDYNRIQDPTGKIPDNEPVFLLRGQDVCAPTAVQAWADEAEKRGADPEMIRKAREWAGEMYQYQANVKRKMPDFPRYQVPEIIAGLSFKINGCRGFYSVLEILDTEITILVQAFGEKGEKEWRDKWDAENVKSNFENGEYWKVDIIEHDDGRKEVFRDPGAIQTPFEALMGEPPKSWAMDFSKKKPKTITIMQGMAQDCMKWLKDEKGVEIIGSEPVYAVIPAGVTVSALLHDWIEYQKTGIISEGAVCGGPVKCVRCGNHYTLGTVCTVCLIDSNEPDQPQ